MGESHTLIGGVNTVKGENDPTGITIDLLNEHLNNHSYIEIPENDFFAEGLIIDVQTINALLTVYSALNESNKKKFEEMVKTSLTLARLLDKVWSWIAPAK